MTTHRTTHRTTHSTLRRIATIALATTLGTALAACSDADSTTGDKSSATPTTRAVDETPNEVTLVAYDAFTPPEGIFDEFTKRTGAKVKVVTGGDSGTVVNKAILTAGNPEGDVLWGIDNTMLSRAQASNVLHTYEPVDFGDVCVNYSKRWYGEKKLAPPQSLDDLIKPEYAGQLVIEDPTNSSPGLAFLLATIAKYGEGTWQSYWQKLAPNGVKIAPDWTTAWTIEYAGAGNPGKYPLVVSYGSSPPAELVYATDPSAIDFPDSGVVEGTCFRQTEYVGVLHGAKNPHLARALVDYLLGTTFQSAMPTSLFVWPVLPEAQIPDVFTRYAVKAKTPLTLEPERIQKNLTAWLETWRGIAL